MRNYMLIESLGEHEARTVSDFFAMATSLRLRGAGVEIMLVQNGVMPARAGARSEALAGVVRAGIAVWADEFSLRERALPAASLADGVTAAPLARVIERMSAGWIVIWH